MPAPHEADTQLLDLYKLTVEMADRVSARRGAANSFFLAIQTALASAAALLSGTDRTLDADRLGALVVSIVGVVLSCSWWVLLRSYRDLNRAKFGVILGIERNHLPIHPFGDEWESLKADPVPWWRGRYAELNTVERVVPVAFLLVYIVLGLRALLA